MFFNDLGERFGLLSGGCLESDLHRKASLACAREQAMVVRYDTSTDDELAYEIGMGCGGIVHILLQPITANNNYLELETVLTVLIEKKSAVYKQRIPDERTGEVTARVEIEVEKKALCEPTP